MGDRHVTRARKKMPRVEQGGCQRAMAITTTIEGESPFFFLTSDCLFFIFYDHVERRCDQPLERDRVGASALSPTQHKRKVLETHNEISGVAPSEHCSTVQLSRCTARFSTVRGRPAFRVKPESPVSLSLAHSSMKYVAPLSTLQHHLSCDAARRLFTRMYTMNHAS